MVSLDHHIPTTFPLQSCIVPWSILSQLMTRYEILDKLFFTLSNVYFSQVNHRSGLPWVLRAFTSPPQWPQRLWHSPLNKGKGINHWGVQEAFHGSVCWTCSMYPLIVIKHSKLISFGYTHRALLVRFLSLKISGPMRTNVVTWLWLPIG